MAAPKKRRPKAPPKEEGDLKTGRFYCRNPDWWSKYSDEELATLQRRGQQLRSGGMGCCGVGRLNWAALVRSLIPFALPGFESFHI